MTTSLDSYRPDFSLTNRTCIITGGTGVLGTVMARSVAAAGANVVIVGRRAEACASVANSIEAAGGSALAAPADVLIREQLKEVRERTLERFGAIDALVNGAGGNVPAATLGPDDTFTALDADAMRDVMDLNFQGTFLPTQIFVPPMIERGTGSIVNVSSMATVGAVTRVAGYSAAKAATENFTRWLAATLALQHGDGLRVNALAPGFFVAEQNRRLLLNEDGSLTERGTAIIANTPMRRFGTPDELLGALIWLLSDASRFVTGSVVTIDGGFASFTGV